jgi:hypothetical protein
MSREELLKELRAINEDLPRDPTDGGRIPAGVRLTALIARIEKDPRASVRSPFAIVEEQANDEGLWFIDKRTASEAYLQQALRRLHAAIKAEPEPEVLAIEEATLQRDPVTGMYNILERLPKDHGSCDGLPLRIEGYLEWPDEVDVDVALIALEEKS